MFITLEGGDGAGKTTQMEFMHQCLTSWNYTVVRTREPGGTELGEKLRGLLLDPKRQPIHVETEAMLMFAARREHIEKVIRPALAGNAIVLCDRFTDSSFAYQCGGSGMDWSRMKILESFVQSGLEPDLTIYLDVETKIAHERRSAARAPDRFEKEALNFHDRVRNAFLRRAEEDPTRIAVVDASADIRTVQGDLARILDDRIHRRLLAGSPQKMF